MACHCLLLLSVASVKQNNSGSGGTHVLSKDAIYSVENLPLREIIKNAYGARSDAQITGGPAAILKNRYDIEAKIDEEQLAQIKKMPSEDRRRQMSLMLQALLADRFHLGVNFQIKELPVYALVLAKGSPKFHPSVTVSPSRQGLGRHSDSRKAEATAYEVLALDGLTRLLAAQPEVGDRTVVNKTGLSGKYDWSLHWTRENNDAAFTPGGSATQPARLILRLAFPRCSLRLRNNSVSSLGRRRTRLRRLRLTTSRRPPKTERDSGSTCHPFGPGLSIGPGSCLELESTEHVQRNIESKRGVLPACLKSTPRKHAV